MRYNNHDPTKWYQVYWSWTIQIKVIGLKVTKFTEIGPSKEKLIASKLPNLLKLDHPKKIQLLLSYQIY